MPDQHVQIPPPTFSGRGCILSEELSGCEAICHLSSYKLLHLLCYILDVVHFKYEGHFIKKSTGDWLYMACFSMSFILGDNLHF